ncbi:MAG: hypothetical protein ACP6IY_09085 [Promethearchaeia archaeon]
MVDREYSAHMEMFLDLVFSGKKIKKKVNIKIKLLGSMKPIKKH